MPLCLSRRLPAGWVHVLLGGGLARPPAPLASATGAGSGLVTMCLGKTLGAAYVGRARPELPSHAQSLAQQALRSPLEPSLLCHCPGGGRGRAAASPSRQPQLWWQGPGLNINMLFFSKHLFQGNKVKSACAAVPALGPGWGPQPCCAWPGPCLLPAPQSPAVAALSSPVHPAMLFGGQTVT